MIGENSFDFNQNSWQTSISTDDNPTNMPHLNPMTGSLNDDSLFQNTKIYYTIAVYNL